MAPSIANQITVDKSKLAAGNSCSTTYTAGDASNDCIVAVTNDGETDNADLIFTLPSVAGGYVFTLLIVTAMSTYDIIIDLIFCLLY